MTNLEIAQLIVNEGEVMVVSTASEEGKPWVSPVGYIADISNRLYWVSSKDAIHSENIRNRPEVSIVILGENPEGRMDGVYFDAIAEELQDESELQEAVRLISKRPKDPKFDVHSISDVSGEAIWRIYRATPKKIWKRADAVKGGQAITIREPVDLI